MDLSYILNALGEERDRYFNAVAPPIIQTSNFAYQSVDEMRRALTVNLMAYLYSRGMNPTVDILRKNLRHWKAPKIAWFSIVVLRPSLRQWCLLCNRETILFALTNRTAGCKIAEWFSTPLWNNHYVYRWPVYRTFRKGHPSQYQTDLSRKSEQLGFCAARPFRRCWTGQGWRNNHHLRQQLCHRSMAATHHPGNRPDGTVGHQIHRRA